MHCLLQLFNFVIFTYADHDSVLIPQPCTESSSMVTGVNKAQFCGTIFNSVVEDHCLRENTFVFPVEASTELSEPVVHGIVSKLPIGIITLCFNFFPISELGLGYSLGWAHSTVCVWLP